ncbi:type VI secretion system-associated FHA domain protein TagH [Yoonia sp. SS1-5]|uniref:Type VI secretion system-associated FHA domain protein TagH n=1 Tax=Yoonia rhodophyticola TaxID=3137370 RepID=A0AAN0MEA5_9RHOB
MTLTLRIENYDRLPDGGPTTTTVTQQGLTVGRSTAMDWTLPDPQKHISSHHFDIAYKDGAYWLTDVSTNGVFLDGQRHRLEGAHMIRQGDRFQVGHYFIGVSLGAGAAAAAPGETPATPPPPAFDDSDPWAVASAPAAPIDPNPRPDPRAFEDFASDFIVNPLPVTPPPAPPQPAPSAPPVPAAAPSPFGNSDSPFGAAPPAVAPAPAAPPAAVAPAPQAPRQPPAPAAPATPGPDQGAAIVTAFCEAAGLQTPEGANAEDAIALARELGATMKVAAAELMTLLQDRAAAKKFTRGGDRTMMGAIGNNPLKFLPDPTQALEVMFLRPRDGFLPGGQGMTAALEDVKTHQLAVFAAIQPALIKLLEDISPEAIEETTGGGLLAGGRRKSWDEFVKRWDAKVGDHENGMLDVFLAHFAESYAAAVDAAKK